MGARQSRRSVDITTTPKKEGLPADGGVGDAAAPGDGKLERIEETDTKPTTNGIAPHTDVPEDKDKDKDDATEKEKDKEQQEEVKETKQKSGGESPAETAEVTTPTEASTPNTATSPDNKETKKKEKMKKKWSFRSISFSKKDKNKPAREEAPKNGDVTKEEPLAEGGEEQENGSGTAGSPVEEKSAVSSPTTENEEATAAAVAAAAAAAAPAAAATAATTAAATPSSPSSPQPPSSAAETKQQEESSGAASAAASGASPLEEKTEEAADPSTAPTPAPLEEKKEEVEKLEAEKKAVEVSPAVGGQSVPEPVVEVSVFRVQTVATPSIIERKTSEDIPSLPPSSPPPTPIDSSPLQQAQQAAATATALAEALKLPAEAARSSQLFAPPSPPASRNPTASPPDRPSSPAVPTVPDLPPLPVVVDGDPPADFESSLAVNGAVEAHRPLPPTAPPPRRKDNDATAEQSSTAAPRNNDNNNPPVLVGDETAFAQQMESSSRLVDPEEDGGRSMDNNAIVSEIVSEIVEESVSRQESISVSRAASSREEEVRELIEEMIAPGEMAREEEEDATVLDPPPVPAVDAIVESEEGPVPVSSEQRNDEEEEEEEKEEEEKEEEEVLVEAKPALVIPEDEEVNEVSRVMETTTRDKLETETTDVAAPVVEEILISEMAEQEHDDDRRPRISARTIAEDSTKPADEARDDESCVAPPPAEPSSSSSLPLQSFPVEAFPVGESALVAPRETLDSSDLETNRSSSSQLVRAEPRILDFTEEEQREELSIEKDIVVEASTDVPSNRQTHEAQEPRNPVSKLERAPSLADDFFPPPAPPEHHATEQQQVDCCFDYPLPPEHLSPPPLEEKPEPRNERPLLPNDGNKDDDNDDDSDARISTETATIAAIPLPPASTLPATPSPTSNASITSGLMPFTVDSSQSLLYDDQSNREFKMESVSISLNSYNESDIELKERLAESLAETEKQEESLVSCQLLNNATSSTTVQETHQVTNM